MIAGAIKLLVDKSTFIIREALARFKNPAVLWSTGKDSTACLDLIRQANFGRIPIPVIHIDTGYKFPEIYEFRDKIAREWGFELIVWKRETEVNWKDGRLKCCQERKTEALKEVIQEYGFDAIIVAIRRDEHGIRMKERYFSPRDDYFRWRPLEQELELGGWGLFFTDFEGASHVRVHPMLHWTELDVWRYIKARGLPFNPLYRADYVKERYGLDGFRYRSLGCMPCTLPVKSSASTIDEIIEELKRTREAERVGRAQDKEDEYAMERLRALGYM